MIRREFIAGLGGVATWPIVVGAQSTLPIVGFLNPGSSNSPNTSLWMAEILEGLKEGGFVEGRNVTVEYRFADGCNDRLPTLVADLVRRQVSVIVSFGTLAALAAKAATTTIPVVFVNAEAPDEATTIEKGAAEFKMPGNRLIAIRR